MKTAAACPGSAPQPVGGAARGRDLDAYDREPPHQALSGAYPGDLFTPSGRAHAPPPEPEYPFHDKEVRVTHCGRICMGRRKINLSRVFAGELVGLSEVDDQVWLVSFLDLDLGFFDQDAGRVEPAQNPFGPEPRIPSDPRKCSPCPRNGPGNEWRSGQDSNLRPAA